MGLFDEFSLCLSRAWLGKTSFYHQKWEQTVFANLIRARGLVARVVRPPAVQDEAAVRGQRDLALATAGDDVLARREGRALIVAYQRASVPTPSFPYSRTSQF